ncbi:MAG: hypothetical protein HYV02_05605 [Deltaproteobacteria bacterium]|nr:hypothetical protein [Deltaproteobacteria bacterium]
MKQRLNIIVLSDISSDPTGQDFGKELETDEAWKTEHDVLAALQTLGHTAQLICLYKSIQPLLDAIAAQKPDLIFNLVEQFDDNPVFEKNIAALIELLGIPITGTGTVGLTLCKHKGVAQSLLAYHRIRVPKFTVFHRGETIRRPAKMEYPLFVKGLRIEGSVGIAKSSFVENDAELKERVLFIHDHLNQDALVEQYIDGRECYVSILGNTRLTAFPLRELDFGKIPPDEPRFATYKIKWDEDYRKRWKIRYRFATDLPAGLERQIHNVCKRAYRILQIRGYGRLDVRVRADGQIFLLEANPNPFLSSVEDFAESAEKGGLTFEALIASLLRLALA